MDAPVETSLLDTGAQGIIGKPLDRIDGPLKVAGKAIYAAEQDANTLHGVLVGARIGKGRVAAINEAATLATPGVIRVFTDFETFARNPQQGGEEEAPTQGVREIAYVGQPLALVVAENLEAAREGAEALVIAYEEEAGAFEREAHAAECETPPDASTPAHSSQGDLDRAMADAAVTIDVTYTTPSQSNAPMEPHATIARWDGDNLILHTANQMLASCRKQMADALGIEETNVRLIAPYVGGGFGSKLGIAPEAVAAALAARELGRPIKAVMSRPQVFEATVRRSDTRQRIRLAAGHDGRLTAIGHETLASNLDGEDFFEPAGIATHFLYAGENRSITHDLVRLNLTLSGSMRCPGEAVGMLALECAMDELAEALGMDPIALRKANEPERDPEQDIPFSSRNLIACMDRGAKEFGWDRRDPTPGGRREGEWLIGLGMAAAARSNLMQRSAARVTLRRDGAVIVETDMTDIGTGSYTILAQIAGEMLGAPIGRVQVSLGDTDLPPAAGSGGSWGANSAGSAVYAACEAIRAKLAGAMGASPGDLTLKDGEAIAGNRHVRIADLIDGDLTEEGAIRPGKTDEAFTQAAFGAHFAEVAVNAVTGETRVRRMLGVFAAGRILNEKTARSQCLGGMTFGLGAALTEELVHDIRNGKCVNHDLAEYHVPANADVPQQEVIFIEERDHAANPMLTKGIGELGISGAGAAIANAIHNACGVRVRDYPLTLDKLLPGLPPV
ncbi:xanthine dehydrogenase family protein molybdopterin-binding subunit [Sphingomonas gilva]|uniref:Xanthine dehydrogenase family protein molybdopterin-binding subunit n=1 Tax=Sphingomonas gilva TaxID=2305907 RepID=A0A396RVN6_9SPHN|nr:xanthine dehydrogenase family protein molybdopterin-binding subunit [Sphingomonas gilva]RHW19472.1 xanthine dehydrogenase family protein molybdopterin-binding subunit [Sphingomonas gilva]